LGKEQNGKVRIRGGVGEGTEWEGKEKGESRGLLTGGKEIGIFRLQSLVNCPFYLWKG
jgi:hypothetical protein